MQNVLDIAQSLVALGFVVAAILGGKFIGDHSEAGSISRNGLLAAYWLGFVPIGGALVTQGPSAFRGLSPGLTIFLKLFATLAVSFPLIIGGAYLLVWSCQVYKNGFFMGANSPGQIQELILGLIGLGLIASGVASMWLIWIACPI